ncbi:P-loop containing nucleoside triphosphate hydrolase protein [Nemania sp. FL0031]|nr:P-loop containing nucleoside triphosphate hydrolase protein [Nemania sp. FL0031]
MESRDHKAERSALAVGDNNDNLYSDRQSKGLDVSQSIDNIAENSGKTAPKSHKQKTHTRTKNAKSAETSSKVGSKRKRDGLSRSTEGTSNKKRNIRAKKPSTKKPSVKSLNQRKVEQKKQIEHMFDWTSRQFDQSSGQPKYTEEQRKRDESALQEGVSLFTTKIRREGHEQDCPNQLFLVEGMSTTIRDYQVVGAAFMLRNERAKNDCRGGIIADDMGIGKTVQAITCMTANPPSKRAIRENKGVTLIVVPNQGLVKQWTEELARHADLDPMRDICKYPGGKSVALGITRYLYVLATYSQVERDFRLHESDNPREAGFLFEMEFFRIILDEGDNIRNYQGSTSKACGKLVAKLKWVLTGTPLRNGVRESLPYFRFIGINIKEKEAEFNERWGKPKTDSQSDRTMQILANRMLRREVGQFFMGREMCKLPRSHIEDRLLSITDEEAIVARHLEQALLRREKESRDRAELGLDDPDAPKSNYYVRCMRLRQAADHPFLLETCIRDDLERDELEDLIAEIIKTEDLEFDRQKIKSEFPGQSLSKSSIYDMAVDIKSHLDDIISSQNNDGCVECYCCVDLQSLECGHLICRSCYQNQVDEIATNGKTRYKCHQCGKIVAVMTKLEEQVDDPWSPKTPRMPAAEVMKTSSGRSVSVVPLSEASKRSPGDDYNGTQPQMTNSSCRWLNKCDKYGQVTPSTKTMEAMKIVKGWQDEAPNDKIVIFTEWIATAKVLGRMLGQANINFVYYNGGISDRHRERNLKDFNENPDIKVMVSSMGAGSVGLNITAANRMIIMTPWWNYAAEAQAVGRMLRHGQKKETYVIRLFAKDTIDERIHALQQTKEAEIKEAMSQGRKEKPLSREEKLWLMGDRTALEGPFDDESDDDSTGNDDSE